MSRDGGIRMRGIEVVEELCLKVITDRRTGQIGRPRKEQVY